MPAIRQLPNRFATAFTVGEYFRFGDGNKAVIVSGHFDAFIDYQQRSTFFVFSLISDPAVLSVTDAQQAAVIGDMGDLIALKQASQQVSSIVVVALCMTDHCIRLPSGRVQIISGSQPGLSLYAASQFT